MFVSLSIYISQKLKYMDILLVILGVICLLVGLAGCFCRSCRGRRWRIWLCGCCILRAMRNLRLRSWSCGDCWSCWHRRWTMLRPCWGLSIAEGPSGEIGDVPWEPWPAYSCFRLGESCWVLSWGLSLGNFWEARRPEMR